MQSAALACPRELEAPGIGLSKRDTSSQLVVDEEGHGAPTLTERYDGSQQ